MGIRLLWKECYNPEPWVPGFHPIDLEWNSILFSLNKFPGATGPETVAAEPYREDQISPVECLISF